MSGWDFDAVAKAVRSQWNEVVSRATVESKDQAFLENFYTAIYHANLAPGDSTAISVTVQQFLLSEIVKKLDFAKR